jgi:hypothetical protein
MKRVLAVVLLLLCVVSVRAQSGAVSVELELDQDQFLSNEDMILTVRITNRSGRDLRLGANADWLTFSVEARDNLVVQKLGDVPVQGEFVVNSAQVATKRVNLTPYFSFRQLGRYLVAATVKIPDWNVTATSRPKPFEIINGTNLRELEFGMPPAAGDPNAPPEVRKYILQQARYLRHLKLYFRLTDASGTRTLRVYPLAMMVSFDRPEAQVDRTSNLHVLNQIGARMFHYCVINSNGEMILRRYYDYTETRPGLRVDDEGKISVAGGTRRITVNDLPVPNVSNTAIEPESKSPKP